MLSIIEAAGWPIWPILFASVISLGIIVERLWSLRVSQVAPAKLLPTVVHEVKQKGVTPELLNRLSNNSMLGRVFAAGLTNLSSSREVVKDAVEEAGRAAAHELERFLTTLGTIASVSPLLGLLGTVIGMVEIFGALKPQVSSK